MQLSNMWTVIFMVFFMISVSALAQELGLTSQTINVPDNPDTPTTGGGGGIGGALDGLQTAITWTFNTIGSFIQLLSFQVDLPIIINTLIISPMVFGLLYLIVIIIRGGAA